MARDFAVGVRQRIEQNRAAALGQHRLAGIDDARSDAAAGRVGSPAPCRCSPDSRRATTPHRRPAALAGQRREERQLGARRPQQIEVGGIEKAERRIAGDGDAHAGQIEASGGATSAGRTSPAAATWGRVLRPGVGQRIERASMSPVRRPTPGRDAARQGQRRIARQRAKPVQDRGRLSRNNCAW